MLEIHHGGKFVPKPLLYYKGGKVDYIYNVNPDLMSLEELKGILVHDYGYTNVTQIHYNLLGRSFTTLRLIVDDSTILDMLKDVHILGGIKIYGEHDFETSIEVGLGDVEKQGNVVEGESTDGESEDTDSDGDSDSDCVSAPSVKNVSDEELIEVRRKYVMNMSGNQVECDKDEEGTEADGEARQEADGGVNL